jgi:hypothetical protein
MVVSVLYRGSRRQALRQHFGNWWRKTHPYRLLICFGHRPQTSLPIMGSLSLNKLLHITPRNSGRVRDVLRRDGANGEGARIEITQRMESVIAFYRLYGHQRLRIDHPKIEIQKFRRGRLSGRRGQAHLLGHESRIAEIDVWRMAGLFVIMLKLILGDY